MIWLHDQPHMIGVYEKSDVFRLADITQCLTEDMDSITSLIPFHCMRKKFRLGHLVTGGIDGFFLWRIFERLAL